MSTGLEWIRLSENRSTARYKIGAVGDSLSFSLLSLFFFFSPPLSFPRFSLFLPHFIFFSLFFLKKKKKKKAILYLCTYSTSTFINTATIAIFPSSSYFFIITRTRFETTI